MTADAEQLLAALRCASLRIKLLGCEVDEVGVSLKHGVITAAGALAWLRQIDGLGFLPGYEEVEHEVQR
jgi:hypothetical protein